MNLVARRNCFNTLRQDFVLNTFYPNELYGAYYYKFSNTLLFKARTIYKFSDLIKSISRDKKYK